MSNWFNRGLSKGLNGDHAGAVKDFTKAIELAPEDEECYLYRATYRRLLKDDAGAFADLEKALKVAPPGWPKRAAVKKLLRDRPNDE